MIDAEKKLYIHVRTIASTAYLCVLFLSGYC